MASARFAWGIDIGNRALKAIKLVPDNGRLRVDDLEVIEHEQILSQSGDNRDALVQTALQNFIARHPIKGGAVAISLSGQASFARFIKLPPVEEKKIPEIVKFEAIQQIPFPLDEVEWSYQLFRTAESTDVEVGIFAIRKDRLEPIMQNYLNLGMNVTTVQLSPLAVYNAMSYDNRLASGATMTVDLGAENTDLIISDGETVWLRTIAVGGNNFTEALAKAFKLNFAKAEDLKRNAATSKYARQIFQAMRPVFADLVSEIQRSIGFYASVHRESRIKRIIALGSTFNLPTLQKYLQQNLQMEVERIDGLGGGTPANATIAATLNENLVSMATAYGLAVQAMGEGKITSSLLPEPIRKAKLWQAKVKWFGIAAACVLLGTTAGYTKWYLDKQHADAHTKDGTAVDRIIADGTKLDVQWAQISKEGADQLATVQSMMELQKNRDVWPKLVADLSTTIPATPDIEKLKAIPRTKRSQIIIDQVQSEYRPDVSDLLKMEDNEFKRLSSSGGVAASAGDGRGVVNSDGGPAVAVAAPGQARGFLLTLRCLTPNEGGPQFLQNATDGMIAKLLKINPQFAKDNKRSYYIAKATVADSKQLSAGVDPTAGGVNHLGLVNSGSSGSVGFTGDSGNAGSVSPGGTAPLPGAGGGRFDRPPVGGRPTLTPPPTPGPITPSADPNNPGVTAAAGPAMPDPLIPTEDMSNDYDLTVLVLVVLDPTAVAAVPGADATTPPAPAIPGSRSRTQRPE